MKPMLCKKATLDEARVLCKKGWKIEHKYDGIRAMIIDGKLLCRRGNDITNKFPEFEGLKDVIGTFDGEVVAETGEFNDVSGRVHMKDKFLIKIRSKKQPAFFFAFDMPDKTKPMEVRRREMEGKVLPAWLKIAPQFDGSELEALWQKVLDKNREGLVIKKPNSLYQFGKHSPSWLKVKNFLEVVATFVKYETNPRGITMETAEGKRVAINGTQAKEVAKIIDQCGKVEAEIQHLPQKDSKAWRWPSFRSIYKN